MLIVTACVVMLTFPQSARTETVRARANRHFKRIQWTQNHEHVQAVAIEGRSIPGGNESFAALIVSSSNDVAGLYPHVDGVGILNNDGVDERLLELLSRLRESLFKKKIDESLLGSRRRFLSPITEYRLERIPEPEYIYFSRPGIDEDDLATGTLALYTSNNGKRNVLFLNVEIVIENGLWKIVDIVFDSESYASFAIKN